MTLWRQKKKNNNFFSSFLNAKLHFSPQVETEKKKLNFTMQDSQMQSISTKLFFINVPFILEHK